MRVAIRSVAHGGEGVGLPDDGGPTWFVAGALPGEIVEATVEHQARRFVRGRLLRVVVPDAMRVDPPCAHATAGCGGCQWQHVAPDRQAELKRRIVADQLRALVDPDRVRSAELVGAALGYRRRARLHYARVGATLKIGFYAAGTHDVHDVDACPVLLPSIDRAVARLREAAHVLPASGTILAIGDGASVILGLPGVRPDPDTIAALQPLVEGPLVGIVLKGARQSHTIGRGELTIDGGAGLPPVFATPFAFSQANAAINRALVRHVATMAKADGARVLELFSGAGNLTRALARTAKRVWAVDDDREAITLLRRLAKAHALPINAKKSAADRLVPTIAAGDVRYDTVVLDPPRKGVGQAAAAAIAKVAEHRIVYVSCDPATLARDLAVMVRAGWAIRDVTVFDMMPMTAEVETVATLVKDPRA